MVHAIQIHQFGGPEVLHWEEVDVPQPGPGQVRLRQTAIGLNYIDVYHRTGLYPQSLPFIPGQEGAGVVEAVGPEVSDLSPGDRVAYASLMGGYAEARLATASRLVKLPETIDDQTAAAMMLRDDRALPAARCTYRVGPDDTILIHAAAGGVGLIVCQWAAWAPRSSARSSQEKAAEPPAAMAATIRSLRARISSAAWP